MEPDAEKGFSVKVELASTTSSGFDLLEEVLESSGKFFLATDNLVHLAMDEFQEITVLPAALKIEGTAKSTLRYVCT